MGGERERRGRGVKRVAGGIETDETDAGRAEMHRLMSSCFSASMGARSRTHALPSQLPLLDGNA